MTQRIIEVVRTICAKPHLIEDITRQSNEFYFRFKGHTFSVFKRPSEHVFYVYPEWNGDLATLANKSSYGDADDVQMIAYHGSDYDDNEFRALYNLLEAKHANVDQIFDDVLSDER